MRRYIFWGSIAATILIGGVFVTVKENKIEIGNVYQDSENSNAPDSAKVASEVIVNPPPLPISTEIPNQKPLENPPNIIKAIYATSWSASSSTKVAYLIDLIKKTELNAIVIDLKDFSGTVTYDSNVPDVIKYKARELRIPKLNALIKKFHDENIYVIGRVTVFQDPILAEARPDLAVKNISNGGVWKDNKGIAWLDPGGKDTWDYNIAIAKDAALKGIDEINFDYIRFPSDGQLSLMDFPFANLDVNLKSTVIRKFFSYLRENTKGIKISADLFGLTAVNKDDLGIGQVIEHAYETFDFVAPMIYPSHYASGFLNFKNPAEHPYEVIYKSMNVAANRLLAFNKSADEKRALASSSNGGEPTPANRAKLRPWLQDFNLGATYDADKIRAQMKATTDALCRERSISETDPVTNIVTTKKICEKLSDIEISEIYSGWMIWDPKNNYTVGALNAE